MSSDYPQIPETSGPPRPVLPTRLLFALLAFAFVGLIGGIAAVVSGGGDDSADASTVETEGDRDAAGSDESATSAFVAATVTPVSVAAGVVATPPTATPLAAVDVSTVPTAIPVATATPLPTLGAAVFVPQPEATQVPPTPVPQPTSAPAPLPTTTPIAAPTPVTPPTPVPFTPTTVDPGTYYVLVDDGLLVRDEPGGSPVTTLQPDAAVVATGEAGQTAQRLWVKLSSPVEGWVAAEFLGAELPGATTEEAESRSSESAAAALAAESDAGLTETADPTPTAEPTTQESSTQESTTQESTAEATPTPDPLPTPTPAPVATTAAGAPTAEQMSALRNCESGGNYAINTGNGYYGAYQFAQATWDAVAGQHYPHLVGVRPSDAAPSDQDLMMIALHADQGFGPWPGCRASLGLP